MGTSVLLLEHSPGIVIVKKGGHDLTLGVLEEFLHGLQRHTVPQEKHPLKHAQGRARSLLSVHILDCFKENIVTVTIHV